MWRWSKRITIFAALAFVILQAVLHVPRMVAFYYWTVANRTDIARGWQEASLAINEHGGWLIEVELEEFRLHKLCEEASLDISQLQTGSGRY